MGEPLVETFESSVADAEINFGLDPDETLIWSGRPKSARSHLLGMMWKTRGELVGWILGTCFGVAVFIIWRNPGGITSLLIIYISYIFTFLRHWFRLQGSRYALTEKRAVIVEPLFLRSGSVTRSYSPLALRLMRREEHADGTGDLIFERGRPQLVFGRLVNWFGFLGIDNAEEVEGLVRAALLRKDRPDAYPFEHSATAPDLKNPSDDPGLERKVYHLTKQARAEYDGIVSLGILPYVVAGVFWWIGIGCLTLSTVAFLVSIPALFLFANPPDPHRFEIIGIASFMMLLSGFVTLFGAGIWKSREMVGTRKNPPEIEVDDDGIVRFDIGKQSCVVSASDILSINCDLPPTIVHKNGTIRLDEFEEFHDFLVTLKALNPAIEFKGV